MVPFVHVDAALTDAPRDAEVLLGPHVAHHLATVLRARAGAELVLADGAGWSAPARLTAANTAVLVAAAAYDPPPVPALQLLQAVPKGRKLDEVVRTATELGVDRVVPVETTRVVGRLEGARAQRARQRWTAVARAACEQSRRSWRPEVAAVTPLTAAVAAAVAAGGRLLVAHPGAPGLPTVLAAMGVGDLSATGPGASATGPGASATGPGAPAAASPPLALLVGPEGGLTDAEVDELVRCGARPVGLGPTVLRTEHAGIAGLAALAAMVGRWSPAAPDGSVAG